jgi:hypothetical protein
MFPLRRGGTFVCILFIMLWFILRKQSPLIVRDRPCGDNAPQWRMNATLSRNG